MSPALFLASCSTRIRRSGAAKRLALASGLTLSVAAALIAGGSSAQAQVISYAQFGGPGNTSGLFNLPAGIAIDRGAYLYVADSFNDRVQKFGLAGYSAPVWTSSLTDSHLAFPVAVATDTSGNVYVADYSNDWVVKFSSTGAYVQTIGAYGTGTSQLNGPSGIAVDSSGNVFVADTGNRRVVKFNGSTGAPLAVLSSGLAAPFGLTEDPTNDLYVTDIVNQDVVEFSPSGVAATPFGSYGTGNGQFKYPYGVVIDLKGRVVVSDWGNNRLQFFSAAGSYLGSYGSGLGLFDGPDGLATTGNELFASDEGHNLIQFLVVGPHVVSVAPASAITGAADTPIVISGVNFSQTSTATIGTTPLTNVSYVNADTLNATIPHAALAAAATTSITVTTPGALGSSSSLSFAVKNVKPTGTVSPTSSAPGVPANITITGTGFYSGTTLSFGTTPLTITSLSPTVITATIPASSLTTPGSYLLNLTNPTGGTTQIRFAVNNPVPVITNISPNTSVEKASGVNITITGSSFIKVSRITFNGQPLTVTFVGPGTLTAPVPAADLTTVGVNSVVVTNLTPGGGKATTTFTVTPGTVTVGSIGISSVPSVTRSGTRLGIKATLTNSSNYAARSFVVTGATLNGVASQTISPATTITLAAGATTNIILTFPGTAAATGSTPTLSLTGTWSNGGPGSLGSVQIAPIP